MGENQNPSAAGAAQKKTTPDEGKTFDKDTVFECVTECKCKGVRYSSGDTITGRICPPHFKVRADLKPKDLEDDDK